MQSSEAMKKKKKKKKKKKTLAMLGFDWAPTKITKVKMF